MKNEGLSSGTSHRRGETLTAKTWEAVPVIHYIRTRGRLPFRRGWVTVMVL